MTQFTLTNVYVDSLVMLDGVLKCVEIREFKSIKGALIKVHKEQLLELYFFCYPALPFSLLIPNLSSSFYSPILFSSLSFLLCSLLHHYLFSIFPYPTSLSHFFLLVLFCFPLLTPSLFSVFLLTTMDDDLYCPLNQNINV